MNNVGRVSGAWLMGGGLRVRSPSFINPIGCPCVDLIVTT